MTGSGGMLSGGGSAVVTGGASTAGRAGADGEPGGGMPSAGAGGGSSTVSPCNTPGGGARYVDATAGDDAKSGSSPSEAWKSLARVNMETFQPGAALCFRAGATWQGQLAPKGSGTAAAPIVIDQYGTGNKPLIAATGGALQAVLLQNVRFWEVNNLEVTNDQATPGDYRGIAIVGKDAGELKHIVIRSCFIHKVSGKVSWIGGDVADNQLPWVEFQTGWDVSKRTGGVVVMVESANGTKTWFNDVVIENNVIQDTSFAGISVKQLDGGYGWGIRSSKSDSKFTPHTNIVVRGNYLSQTNTKYGCNAVYLTGARHSLIERNVCQDAGTSAIEAYNSDDVVVQYNETFGTVKKAGGADSNGIDADRATTGAVIQYNYVHDNGDGILLCQIAFGDAVVRYNVVVNNGRHAINLHSDTSATNQTYNNLIAIVGANTGDLINSSGGADFFAGKYAFSNNIFRSSRAAAIVASGSGLTYANNLFSGVTAQGSGAQTADPMFVDANTVPKGGAAGSALSKLQGFQLKAGSAALEHGVMVANNGGHDFWDNPLYQGTPDIGPFEKP